MSSSEVRYIMRTPLIGAQRPTTLAIHPLVAGCSKLDPSPDATPNESCHLRVVQRMAINELGLPLDTVTDPLEHLIFMRESVRAIKGLRRLQLLHGDISKGNIVVSAKSRKAFLVDLGLTYRNPDPIALGPIPLQDLPRVIHHRPTSTGMLPYMAMDLLRFNTRERPQDWIQHEGKHDLESIFWVSYVSALEAATKDKTNPRDDDVDTHITGLEQANPSQVMQTKFFVLGNSLPPLNGALCQLRPYLDEYREYCWKATRAQGGAPLDCDLVEEMMTRHIGLLTNPPSETEPVLSADTTTSHASAPSTPKRKHVNEGPADTEVEAADSPSDSKRRRTPQASQSPHTASRPEL